MIQIFLARLGLTFAGHGLKIALVLGIVATVATWDRGRIKQAEKKGAELVRVETKKATDAAVTTADRIRARAQSRGVRGQRDPNSID